MGVPAQLRSLRTTRPYYRSSYVFVTRKDRHLRSSRSTIRVLRQLRIGVQMIGDDGMNTPPAHALGNRGIIDNVVGYTVTAITRSRTRRPASSRRSRGRRRRRGRVGSARRLLRAPPAGAPRPHAGPPAS